MGLSRTLSVTLTGLEGGLVEVECDIAPGLPGLSFTGLPDPSVMEARDRIRAAIQNSENAWPSQRITVALLPADVRKVGSRFDLAICVAVLGAAGTLSPAALADTVWLAELGLDGRLRPVRGVLPSVLAARRRGIARVVVAHGNAAEAAAVQGVQVRSAETLRDVVLALTGHGPALPVATAHDLPAGDLAARAVSRSEPGVPDAPGASDLSEVAGQAAAKRALEIAAAGGHHLFLVGAPGAGKTMLAERLPALLPELDDEAAMEVTAVHSVAGRLGELTSLIRRPPLEAPHHTASMAALVGGGSGLARPGAISLAHHGVLFLDEAAEFPARSLDALREPLESGRIVLSRRSGSVLYPARFQLVLAANPCPCARRPADCDCPAAAKLRHQQRLSGPLMDRIDLRVQVEPVLQADLFGGGQDLDTSATVAERVRAARTAARARWAATGHRTNAEVPGSIVRAVRWRPARSVTRSAEGYLERGQLSARGFDRVLRIAWTLADLAGRDGPTETDMSEALFFRTGQVDTWAA